MVIFRIECEVDILLNIDLYQHTDFGIRWASGKWSVRFVTIMMARKLSFNMVFDRNFQEMI